jgi:hypothetical protein
MDRSTADLEGVTAQVAGLERFLRARLLNTLTRTFLVLVLVGGLVSAATSHFLETASICIVVPVASATWFIVHYLQLDRGLHTDPVREVTRLHTKRKIKNAGFVDAVQTSMGRPTPSERRESEAPGTDPYAALRDIDVLGQKSADGLNRTDDPSLGPIE